MIKAKPAPYSAPRYELGCTRAGPEVTLAVMTQPAARELSAALAAIDPWARLSVSAAQLETLFTTRGEGAIPFAIRAGSQPVGAVVIRYPWLHGPYLNFLGLTPEHQRRGIGALVLEWMEREVQNRARNLWLCVASFNTPALRFYERRGFTPAATLDSLLADRFDEVLMRKRLPAEPRLPNGT